MRADSTLRAPPFSAPAPALPAPSRPERPRRLHRAYRPSSPRARRDAARAPGAADETPAKPPPSQHFVICASTLCANHHEKSLSCVVCFIMIRKSISMVKRSGALVRLGLSSGSRLTITKKASPVECFRHDQKLHGRRFRSPWCSRGSPINHTKTFLCVCFIMIRKRSTHWPSPWCSRRAPPFDYLH